MKKESLFPRSSFFEEFNTLQNQYTYFIMAIDASAIAYSVQKIDQRVFAWSLLPLGLALIFWGISFFSGLRFNQCKKEISVLELENLDLIDEEKETSALNSKKDKLLNQAKQIQTKMYRYYNFMNYGLMGGIILFVVWTLIEMGIRTFTAH
jgi:uncharacterized membrane protein